MKVNLKESEEKDELEEIFSYYLELAGMIESLNNDFEMDNNNTALLNLGKITQIARQIITEKLKDPKYIRYHDKFIREYNEFKKSKLNNKNYMG